MERSMALLVALLGILKAGGAFVPLDPEHPDDRLASILDDSRLSTIISEQRFVERFAERGAILTCLDDASITQESIENPRTNVAPENSAYVIYTSGTTGTPKGVMIEHRSLVNYVYWFNQTVMAGKAPILPAVTKLTFDASLKQLFAPLLRGGQVWILPDDVISEPTLLVEMLSTGSRTGLNCVPTLWNTLLEIIESQQVPMSTEALSVLLLGGEQFHSSLIDRTQAVFPDVEIWNLYGPTEATANALAGRVNCERRIGLGKPIANVRIAILDASLQPVPIGVTGELYIGGHGLARGYLGSAHLTAEKFIPDPFSDEPGTRLYRTGDLARYLRDGCIEFLGRRDYQVKVRGFRVELGEVEAVLSQHPAVREAAVLAREEIEKPKSESENSKSAIPNSQCSVKRLVAYVVPNHHPNPTSSELRSFLKTKLPDYMIPSAFVFLDAFPLTGSGKLDRRSLPAPDPMRLEVTDTFTPPRNRVEEMLVGILAEVLKVKEVGIHDNFFDLGGHSLLATQIISRLREAFRVDLPLRALFEDPTVASLAVRIALLQAKGNAPETLIDVLARLESCSDEEAQLLLAQESSEVN
jgi:amino acid adenylation domain-containing protein